VLQPGRACSLDLVPVFEISSNSKPFSHARSPSSAGHQRGVRNVSLLLYAGAVRTCQRLLSSWPDRGERPRIRKCTLLDQHRFLSWLAVANRQTRLSDTGKYVVNVASHRLRREIDYTPSRNSSSLLSEGRYGTQRPTHGWAALCAMRSHTLLLAPASKISDNRGTKLVLVSGNLQHYNLPSSLGKACWKEESKLAQSHYCIQLRSGKGLRTPQL